MKPLVTASTGPKWRSVEKSNHLAYCLSALHCVRVPRDA